LTEVDDSGGITVTPRETLAMDFAKVKYTFAPQGGASVVFEFDVAQNQGSGGGSVGGQYVLLGNSSMPPGLSGASRVSGFATGISASSSSVGGGAGKATFRSLSLQKAFDAATIAELRGCASGAHSPLVDLSLVRDGGGVASVWFQYELTDVLVSSVALATDGNGELQESVGFDFRKIQWTFSPPGAAQQKAAFDIAAGKAAARAPF
jgi:type VI protein secretion system component Hcp